MEATTDVSIEAYFRSQMTAIGATVMEQVGQLHVLIAGLGGCGVEIAKCLALTGVQRLTLMDDELVRETEIATNFVLRGSDVGKPKSKAVAARLSELAPFVDVRTVSGALSLDLLLNFHVVVFAHHSQISHEEVIAYDEFCRSQLPPIGVVVTESRGLFGYVFTDFAARHCAVHTIPGAKDLELDLLSKQTRIVSDTADGVTVCVTVRDPLLAIECLSPGDNVVLAGSSSGEADQECCVDEVTSPVSMRLTLIRPPRRGDVIALDLAEFKLLRRVSTQLFTTQHRSLRQCWLTPGTIQMPLGGGESIDVQAFSLHSAMMAIHAFRREFGVLPASNNRHHIQEALRLVGLLQQRQSKLQYLQVTPDASLVEQVLRCVSTEFQPLCCLMAGFAALQVLKHSGAMGPLLHSLSQFMYFDCHDMVNTGVLGKDDVRDGDIAAILGEKNAARLKNAHPLLYGLNGTNAEVLKNLVATGVGSSGSVHVALDTGSSRAIEAADVQLLLISPSMIGHFLPSALKLCFPSVDIQEIKADQLPWKDIDAVCSDNAPLKVRVAIDDECRAYEKPAIVLYEDIRGVWRSDVVVPHLTGTYSERLIASRHQTDLESHKFDYIPSASTIQPMRVVRSMPERCAIKSLELYEMLFESAVELAHRHFESRDDRHEDTLAVWLIWTVAQRGHVAHRGFHDCLRVAWAIVELVPFWLERNNAGDDGLRLLSIDIHDPEHAQMLVATACIIASSVGVTIPTVEERRCQLVEVSVASNSISLRENARTVKSILEGFNATAISSMLEVVKRVEPVCLDLDDISKGHLHLVQALTNLQLAWCNSNDRIVDLPHVRRVCRRQRDFVPVTTILGAIATLQLFRLIINPLHSSSVDSMYEYVAVRSPSASAALAERCRPPSPLRVNSLPMEVTRGVPLRVIPEGMSRWTKIVLPTSTALQSLRSIAAYLEKKYQISIHAASYRGRHIASMGSGSCDNLDSSIFDVCRAISPGAQTFVLVDFAASDARGDVVLAPVRINRPAQ